MIIFTISILTFLLLININVDISKIEMPVVYSIKSNFIEFEIIYGIVILIAIFTTAISTGMSFLNNVCVNKKSYQQIAAIMCISSILVSQIGFSKLVKVLFPLFGYIGILQIYFIVKSK